MKFILYLPWYRYELPQSDTDSQNCVVDVYYV